MSADIGRGTAILAAIVLMVLVPIGIKAGHIADVINNEIQLCLDEFVDVILINKKMTSADMDKLTEKLGSLRPGIQLDLCIGKNAVWFEEEVGFIDNTYGEILTGEEIKNMLEDDSVILLCDGDGVSVSAGIPTLGIGNGKYGLLGTSVRRKKITSGGVVG